jgi:hypothetical protein
VTNTEIELELGAVPAQPGEYGVRVVHAASGGELIGRTPDRV